MTGRLALEVWARPEHLIVHPAAADLPPGGTRSHLSDGRTVTWSPRLPPGVRYAVDAEIADQPVPRALAARFGRSDPESFWTAWTRVEVCCKLHDVPLLAWLSRHGLSPDDAVPTRTLRVGDLLVCYGVSCWRSASRRTSRLARAM
jgi:hypothetical protein